MRVLLFIVKVWVLGMASVIDELYSVILDRIARRPPNSYTVSLIEKGREYIARKVGEEAIETIIASLTESRDRFVSEVADLIYHLLVLMAINNVSPDDIYRELRRRMK